MNRTRAPAFHSAERALRGNMPCAISGPISRTWYKDEGVLAELFEWVLYLQADLAVLGDSPFLITTARAAELCGFNVERYASSSPEAEAYFSAAAVLIVLGARTSTKIEDIPYVERAMAQKKSVLVIWPDGRADYHGE